MTTTRVTGTGPQGGIRINSGRTTLPTAEEREQIYSQFEMYHAMGISDLGIAERTGTCDRTVRRWRWRNKLPNLHGKTHDSEDVY
jgi:hypothetical protein